MRRFYPPIIAILILVIFTAGYGAERLTNSVLLYVRVARLFTQDPPARIAMPVQDVQKKQIIDTWHAPRGADRLHEGQDIFAPRGTPVYSATKGYIYNVGENNLGGQTVSVAGAGGRFYYYAHLDSYAPHVEEGDYVTPQTVLGYVGTTGNAQGTPPHLHFGIYTPAGPTNPLPLLTDRPKPIRDNPVKQKAKEIKNRNRRL
ncbi:MAG TPA: M23 family metallopeptidase [Pyrinomonadaceae bacterium]|nr:M23 family metallopeptidase [Pyrinomonadaceae bacterium]